MQKWTITFVWITVLSLSGTVFVPLSVAEEELPFYLKDRGTGIATSMFGTYVRSGGLLLYPFIEYYRDSTTLNMSCRRPTKAA